MKLKLAGAFIAMVLCLAGCESVKVTDYKDYKPILTPETFFNGNLVAHGVVKDRAGKVIRYFTANIKGTWENKQEGKLEESFLFNDGEKQSRVWKMKKTGPNEYIATAGDVIGEAKIQTSGNGMFLNYVLRIPYNDSTLDITVDDRMYLVDEKVVLNESKLSKFGFDVGSMMLVIEQVK